MDRCVSVFFLAHIVYPFYAHSPSDLTILLTSVILVEFHNVRQQHCIGHSMRRSIKCSQRMSHAMYHAKPYIRESHAGHILTESHIFSSLRVVFYSRTQRS